MSGSLSISASQGAASVIMRAETYASSGETTTVVPRSRASARISSDGRLPFGVTSSDDAELDRAPLGVLSIADHHHVARPRSASAPTRSPSC